MKKRIGIIFMILALCFTMTVTGVASGEGFADEYYRLMDMGGVLTDEEEEEILTLLDDLSISQSFEFVIATIDSLDGASAESVADDLYDECNFGYGENRDGVLLLISVEDREWHISTCGYGITAFTDGGIEYIGDQMLSDLSEGNYKDAFRTFLGFANQFVSQARNGNPFEKAVKPRKPFSQVWIPIALVIGFIIARIIVGSMKRKMKSVQAQMTAASYIQAGSLHLTQSQDLFLYNKVERREKPKEESSGGGGSSTHTSSSGTTHGGGGGKF